MSGYPATTAVPSTAKEKWVAPAGASAGAGAGVKTVPPPPLPISTPTITPLPSVPFGIDTDMDASIGVSTKDIHAHMRALESYGKTYCPEARYLKFRRVLGDFLSEVSEDFGLSSCTVHVAIGYLDRFLQQANVARNRLQLVAMCCLLVAAKYEEAEENVPTVAHLNEYANNSYKPEIIHRMEVKVLEKLGWSLTVITPLHFLGYFFHKGVLFSSDTMMDKPLVEKVPRYLAKYHQFFADLCQQDYSFQQYLPSHLAAAIVLCARRALNVSPNWNPALQPVLCYTYESLEPCATHIWSYFKENFPGQASASAEYRPPGPTPTGVSEI